MVALYAEGDYVTWFEWGAMQTAKIADSNEAFGRDPMYIVELLEGRQWPVFESEAISVTKADAA